MRLSERGPSRSTAFGCTRAPSTTPALSPSIFARASGRLSARSRSPTTHASLATIRAAPPPTCPSLARYPMPEADKEGQGYQAGVRQAAPGFCLKGADQLDWGMKNRLARTFNPVTGRTVMLAVDHGYFQGPTTGLERIDLSIVPLLPQCDAL